MLSKGRSRSQASCFRELTHRSICEAWGLLRPASLPGTWFGLLPSLLQVPTMLKRQLRVRLWGRGTSKSRRDGLRCLIESVERAEFHVEVTAGGSELRHAT